MITDAKVNESALQKQLRLRAEQLERFAALGQRPITNRKHAAKLRKQIEELERAQ